MRTNRQPRRAPRLIARGGWVIVLALALLAWLVPAGAANAQDGSDGTGSDTGGSGSTDSGSTGSGSTGSGSTDSGSTDSSGGTRAGGLDSGGTREEGETNQPSGPVAYVNADGEVLVGIGEATPAVVGAFAALGANSQGSVAIAPTADAVAYVRSDGALVMVTTEGTDARVLATDVALGAVGANRMIGWDSTGDRLSYVAAGTEEQVADTSTRPRSRQSGTFLAPLPSGPLGDILKVVDRAGNVVSTIGDPSLRSVVGVNWSPADPVMVVDSEIPGTTDRYTLSIATEGSNELAPTTLSVDEPAFAPDGSFVVSVGPVEGAAGSSPV